MHGAEHAVHADDGAGEIDAARSSAHLSVAGDQRTAILWSKHVLTRRTVDRAAGIGDQAESLRPLHLIGEPQQFRGEVIPVGDHLGTHLRDGEDELLHARLHRCAEAGAERRHRTHHAPEVVDVPHPRFERRYHLTPAGVRVPACDEATMLAGEFVELDRPGEFGGTGRDAD